MNLFSLYVKINASPITLCCFTKDTTSIQFDQSKMFPLVNLDTNGDLPTEEVAQQVTHALKKSGFLIIKSPALTIERQRRAIKAASEILSTENSSTVVTHPTDPKVYAMLHGLDFDVDGEVKSACIQDLKDWYNALRSTKDILLRSIAIGLGMDDADFFVNLHNEHNDALRLLMYHPGDENTGNRCKEHSDYGTLTLLLIDGVGGLEAFVDGQWRPVPYEEGSIVVNIGSILSRWTRDELSATLHRVAGPASSGSNTPKGDLIKAISVPRISLAYFADPNENVSISLEDQAEESEEKSMSISEYIYWRSGGAGADRDGVALTSTEKDRLDVAS